MQTNKMSWKEYPEDFFVKKREALEFLESIDYDSLQKRADNAFSEPNCLQTVNNEIGSLEARLANFKKEDKISFPIADDEIEEHSKKLETVAAKFRERAKKDYERAVREFPKEFADTEKQTGNIIQMCIKWLGGLSKTYKAARDICNLPKNAQLEDYFQFTQEIDVLDNEVDLLIGKYKEAKTRKDVESVKQNAKQLQKGYKTTTQKRKKHFTIHPAFQYENKDLNALEKELGKDMFSARENILTDISTAVNETARIKNGGSPKKRTGFDKNKYEPYKDTIFLSELIDQYASTIDELKKVREDNYNISRRCMQIEEDVTNKEYDKLRRTDSTAFSHLEQYKHCQKHLERYSALCTQASELVNAYDKNQEIIKQRSKERTRKMELEKVELKRRAKQEEKQKDYIPPSSTPPSFPERDKAYSNIFIDLEDLSPPADATISELSGTLERFGISWGGKLAEFNTKVREANPVSLETNQDYLKGLKKCLIASIENGTLTTEISINPSLETPARESLAALEDYIAKCA